MTIAASWVRKVNSCEELVFISDSRLCGGQRWDECPKLSTLPGKACALAFAGDADYAYPMMMQIRQAMSGYYRIESRAIDIVDINGHVLNHINHLMTSVYDLADPDYVPDIEFLFGGYSWSEKRFRIWEYAYKKSSRAFEKNGSQKRLLPNVNSKIAVIGDQKKKYKEELRAIIKEKYGHSSFLEGEVSLDMEPFEALCRMLRRATKDETIGGAPQMIKVYQYLNSRPVGVYWPEKIDDFSNRTILGRTLFDYENTELWFIDPKTHRTNACIGSPKENDAI